MEELKSKKVMGAINLRTQKRKVENTKAVLEEKKSSLFDDVENSSIIEEKLGSYTEEQVEKMTKEELFELDKFIVDNGLKISLPEELKDAKGGIKVLGGEVMDDFTFTLSDQNDYRHNIVIKKVKSTPAKYPRNYGQIKKKPL